MTLARLAGRGPALPSTFRFNDDNNNDGDNNNDDNNNGGGDDGTEEDGGWSSRRNACHRWLTWPNISSDSAVKRFNISIVTP